MQDKIELSERREWSGTSPEGLAFQIAHWGVGSMCDGAGMWNYYVTIPEDQLRPEDWDRVWLPVQDHYVRSSGHAESTYREYDSILAAGDFHGGITFYEKGQQVDGTRRWIKVGCDYGHLWDSERGYPYSLETVRHDALNTCARLAEVLRPLVRCGFIGQFFDPRFDVSDGVSGWRGGPLSPAGLGCKSMWNRKDREREAARLAA